MTATAEDLKEIEIKTAQDLIDYIQRKFTSPELVGICSPEMRNDEKCLASKCVTGEPADNDYVEYLVLAFNDIYVD